MSKVRILLADDHAVVCAGIRNALEKLPGLEIVAEVRDGPELFAALAQMQPECLLIDVTMPDFEPLAAIPRIRALYPNMKILVVSAYDDDVYVQGLLRAGVNGYHLKDQPLSDLRLAVQRVLAGERWISSPLLEKLVSPAGTSASPPLLTTRQRDLLQLLHQGFDNQAIAQRLSLSVKTVENHLTRLYRHLNVQSRLEAANYALQYPQMLISPGHARAQSSGTPEAPVQERVVILLVDDNTRYRRQLRQVIGKVCLQAVIYEAGNIEEAVSSAQRVAPQLVLIDVVLDKENGIHCARRIKTVTPSARIVLISAYPDREFHRLGLEAGAIAFLDKKDLDAAALGQMIHDVATMG